MTPEQHAKLPLYAQQHIQWLTDRVRGLEDRLKVQKRVHAYDGGENGILYGLDTLRNDMQRIEHAVRIPLDVSDGCILDVTTFVSLKDGAWRIKIRSTGSQTGILNIRPEAANVITVGVEPW